MMALLIPSRRPTTLIRPLFHCRKCGLIGGEIRLGVSVMVFNATFHNISVTSSVLLVEETGVPREKHRPVASH